MSFIKFGLAVYEIVDNEYIVFKGRKIKADSSKMNYPMSERLEDLFDEVIMVKHGGKPHLVKEKNASAVNGGVVYGAIWIELKLSDGTKIYRLDPVAILNEKGKFELLNLR